MAIFRDSQWRITIYEEGEAPDSYIWRRFADAWADAVPDSDAEPDWIQIIRKSEARQLFEAGVREVTVARSGNYNRTIIERL